MADQGKWFKLWCSVLNDPHIDGLDIDQFGRWCKLGALIKEQGNDGVMELIYPARTFQAQMQVTSWLDLLGCIKRLPGYAIEMRDKMTREEMKSVTANVTVESVTYFVKCQNWQKYQGDFSNDRVRKYRQRVTANVTAQEEKRREEKRITTQQTPPFSGVVGGPEKEPPAYAVPDKSRDPVKYLVLAFKVLRGVPYANRAWDRQNFKQAAAGARALLDAFDSDVGAAATCLQALAAEYAKRGTNWKLQTVARDAPEWKSKNLDEKTPDDTVSAFLDALTKQKDPSNADVR